MGDEWIRLETLLDEMNWKIPEPTLEEQNSEENKEYAQQSLYSPEPRYGC